MIFINNVEELPIEDSLSVLRDHAVKTQDCFIPCGKQHFWRINQKTPKIKSTNTVNRIPAFSSQKKTNSKLELKTTK